MGSYNIPRNVKGEGRILYIFSTKSLIYTGVGALAGGLFYVIFSMINLANIGLIFVAVGAIIGFIIGKFKIPKIANVQFTNKVAGENIDEVIKRWIKFKKKKQKIYVYKGGKSI